MGLSRETINKLQAIGIKIDMYDELIREMDGRTSVVEKPHFVLALPCGGGFSKVSDILPDEALKMLHLRMVASRGVLKDIEAVAFTELQDKTEDE